MNRIAVAAIVISLGFASAAHAALAPQYYQQARDNAADVVVIAVSDVSALPADGYGTCTVTGEVAAVERGATYSVGQEISIAVPCMRPRANVPAGPAVWQRYEALRTPHHARAYLNRGALALSQYEIIAADAHAGHH